ncbi:hypothetical protein San01_05670 [Streptomyces angustmyceticus]|uniref:Uncharacterized protein n=1 Tax=Streptomyces angustmyceticus TaxID=285578 RepID=A0A5J4L9C4_9ACTN|nr:hypothetical protein San01_05670 [Streptomyces angustmyceticus]
MNGRKGPTPQIVPLVAAGQKSVKLVEDATLKVCPGAPHGLPAVAPYKEDFHADLLSFLDGRPRLRAREQPGKTAGAGRGPRGPLGRHRLARCRDYLRWPSPQPPRSQPSLKTGPT